MAVMDFHQRYGPWAVVAGASEGVGASVARLLGERGVRVVMVSRRKQVLDDVAATVATQTRTVEIDLSEVDAAASLADSTADLDVGTLIYNAGAVPPARFLDTPIAEWQAVLARNCSTVVSVVHHFGAQMVRRGCGGIVLMGSNAGWAGSAGLAVYSASKAFDLVLGESLWAEFRPLGVDVVSMVLGATDTPAFSKVPKRVEIEGMADPDDVAREMLDSLVEGPTIPPGPAPYANVSRRDAVELRSRQLASAMVF